ncbi:MAG: hypothetical protein AAF939_11620 [Planctomycetota bacterium]
MLVGPVFSREAVVAPRRPRHYITRTIYAVALLLLMCTAWMVLTGTQRIRNVGDMARFGAVLFQILAPLQLGLILFLSAMQSASNIAIEKDRQTLILLLMSRLTNSELVVGKLLATLLNVGVMLIASLPIFMLIVLFGGTSFQQVGWTYAVTSITALSAGSLGATIAFWREKTFQTLALVAMCIVFWLGFWEGFSLLTQGYFPFDSTLFAGATNPLRAILAASHPTVSTTWSFAVVPYLIASAVVSVSLSGYAVMRVRKWNPNRDVRVGQKQSESADDDKVDMFTGQLVLDQQTTNESTTGRQLVEQTETLRSGHVDDRKREASQKSRNVWDNPILWREMKTWAYGRKILFIRLAYWLLAASVFFAVYSLVSSGVATRVTGDVGVTIPAIARPLAPFILVSIVMVNALAVTSITTERDGRALDLLRVTDISPREFLFGKLLGVLYVVSDMILLPILICGYLAYNQAMTVENFSYLVVGLSFLYVFVTMLGIHAGMSYSSSRQAITISLGTVFFLFLGVVTSMAMMISFTGNVEAQLGPFLAVIVGGAIGLYVSLGRNTPSTAMVIASGLLPIAMFYSITSLLLEKFLSALIVFCFTYGWATTAMMIPRLSEFIVSSDRAKTADGE